MFDLTAATGLEILRAMMAGDHPPPTMAATANITIAEAEEGSVTFHGTPTEAHLNPLGVVHGGWYGTILDSALGCSVQSVLPAGRIYLTLEYKVNLVRALRPGMAAAAKAVVQHAGRSTGVAAAELRGIEDGRLYATGNTTCLMMDRPGA